MEYGHRSIFYGESIFYGTFRIWTPIEYGPPGPYSVGSVFYMTPTVQSYLLQGINTMLFLVTKFRGRSHLISGDLVAE